MKTREHKSAIRRLKASWRDTLLLLREFRLPLFWFIFFMVGFGALYQALASQAGEPVGSFSEAVYQVLGMTFLNPASSFPQTWYLQLFYFLMPVIGIGILAQGLADFGILLFNRRLRGKEWEMAVASTFSNHIVLVGLGHLGFRVVKHLHDIGEEVVAIELNPKRDLVERVRAMDVPVLQDDATPDEVLAAAGIQQARAIILCTQNDALNLQIAVKARSLNQNIQVVVRIFDGEFAESLRKQFGFDALSATGMAAPVFAFAATQIDITPPINIEGRPNSLARLKVENKSLLAGKEVGMIEDQYQVSIVFIAFDHEKHHHPTSSQVVKNGDTLAILGEPDRITALVNDNHR